LVLELCRTSWLVTQIAPALCDRLGDGDGLGVLECDRDGDGLGVRDPDGLGLLLEDGLGLLLVLGLEELVGLCDALRLALFDGLGLLDGLAIAFLTLGVDATCIASRLADTAWTPLRPHGELMGLAGEAKAGAMAKPDARNDPAKRETAMRPARAIATGTVALRSPRLATASRVAGVVPFPQA
jgi:hypothetical protein